MGSWELSGNTTLMLISELSLLMHSNNKLCIILPDLQKCDKTTEIIDSIELFNYQVTFIEKFGIASAEVKDGVVKIINDKFEKR